MSSKELCERVPGLQHIFIILTQRFLVCYSGDMRNLFNRFIKTCAGTKHKSKLKVKWKVCFQRCLLLLCTRKKRLHAITTDARVRVHAFSPKLVVIFSDELRFSIS